MTGKLAKKKSSNLAPLVLYGKALPYVDRIEHLGHVLDYTGSQAADCRQRRGQYISRSCEIISTLDCIHPCESQFAVKLYCGHAYGSNTWDFTEPEFNSFCKSWSTTIKDLYRVPRGTHKYIVDHLLQDSTSLKTDLLLRYRKFYLSLTSSPSKEVRMMAYLLRNDLGSTTGRNLRFLQEGAGRDPLLCSRKVLKDLLDVGSDVPDDGQWVLDELGELLGLQLSRDFTMEKNPVSQSLEEDDGLDDIIEALCLG